jgi:hypothetical protein
MSRGICPNNRPKWITCRTCCRGRAVYARTYRGREVWRCTRCGRTTHRTAAADTETRLFRPGLARRRS